MKRLSILLVLGLSALIGSAGEQRFEITGNLQLPAGATLPPMVKIQVDLYKVEPGQVITFLKRVGRQQFSKVDSTPIRFAVPFPKSVLKETPAKSFVLRASVYEVLSPGGSKLLYETPEKEMVAGFTATGEPRRNVLLPMQPKTGK